MLTARGARSLSPWEEAALGRRQDAVFPLGCFGCRAARAPGPAARTRPDPSPAAGREEPGRSVGAASSAVSRVPPFLPGSRPLERSVLVQKALLQRASRTQTLFGVAYSYFRGTHLGED